MGADALFTRAVAHVVPMVRESGVTVIVGDVETQAQFEWWRAAGADIVQGQFTGSGTSAGITVVA